MHKTMAQESTATRAAQCALQTPSDGYFSINEKLCEEGKIDPGTGGLPSASP